MVIANMLLTTTLILGNTTQTFTMYTVNNMSSRTTDGFVSPENLL